MPDEGSSQILSTRFSAAVDDVEKFLSSFGERSRRLTQAELRGYDERRFVQGWRLQVSFPDQDRNLDLLVDRRFPRSAPRVAMVNGPDVLSFPHIEEDGLLCLLSEAAEVDPLSPDQVAKHVLRLACKLIEELTSSGKVEDFRGEFQSYWNRVCSERAGRICSLLRRQGPSREVRLWRGRQRYVIAEDDVELERWLNNAQQDAKSTDREFETAILVWLREPMLPKEYPKTGRDVLALAEGNDAGTYMEALAGKEECGEIVVVFGALSEHGPCFAGVVVPRPVESHWPHGRSGDRLIRGFRPDKVPRRLIIRRYFSSENVVKKEVLRADAAWVHGRDHDSRQSLLADAKVVVLGCGSVGASVATLLAKAGVGNLFLVDPQRLSYGNIGRHALGAGSAERAKAEELAKRIRTDHPHIREVRAREANWEDLKDADLAEIKSANAIVSAIGDWCSEGLLNEWHTEMGREFPVVYGWTEPHGVAGHAVAICSEGGCMQCGLDRTGRPEFRVADWPNGNTLRQEAACGAVFQPYGAVELGYVVGLISELCLDCLLGNVDRSTHRVWAARRSQLTAVGGSWTQEWQDLGPRSSEGGLVEELPWPVSVNCPECQVSTA
jgi:sulfur-carrier protein adenylyltransferase/sulfurtransferase